MSETLATETLNVIDDHGNEIEIPQSEFWMYDEDGLPHWITPQEHAEQEGLEHRIDIHGEETERNAGE